LAGLKVPVKVIVDVETKEFEIEIGTPPVSALIKRELGIEKGSGRPGSLRAGDLSMEQVKKIAKTKFGSDEPRFVNQVIGTCRSMGISVGQGPLSEEEKKKLLEAQQKKA